MKSCIDQFSNSEEIVDKRRQNIRQCENEIKEIYILIEKTNDQSERDKLKAEKQAVRETEQQVRESTAKEEEVILKSKETIAQTKKTSRDRGTGNPPPGQTVKGHHN